MGASHLPTPSSDSPTHQQLQNLAFTQQRSHQQTDQILSSSQQTLYSNGVSGASAQYSNFAESDMQSPNSAFEGPYRNPSVYGPIIGGRTRQNTIQTSSSSFINDSNPGPFSPFQASASESFTVQNGSVPQPQMNNARTFDFMNEQPSKPIPKPIFNMDPFGTNGSNAAALLQPHQLNKILQQHSQQQQQLQSLQNQSMGMVQTPQAHSQTPFGPHVSSNGSAGLGLGSVVSLTNNQEEISTIFVVGFPDDMQEREFQNMFTFSPGFEAATLKIPNKDLTAYGSNVPPTSASINGRTSMGFGLGYSYNGANDPYNLVTMNQGGVVVDGRDGTTTSWPSADPDIQASLSLVNPNGVQNGPAAPRKQIIGFAKFRTRAEALAARDLLQGRRVDIEKGAVLKAEMAKKNLHTKRGVGPLAVPLGPSNSANGGMNPGMNGMQDGMSNVTSMMSPGAGPGSEALTARERELGSFASMNVGGVRRDRDRYDLQDEDRESRRRRETLGAVPSLSTMQATSSIGMLGQRGPRERLEEDERERKRKEKEMMLVMERSGGRMRQNTIPSLSSYDSFQSNVTVRGGSMANFSNAMLSPSSEASIGGGGGYPFPISPQDGNVLDNWAGSGPGPQSMSGLNASLRNKIGSLNLNGALHSLSIPNSTNGSVSTSAIPTRPSSSHASSPSEAHDDSFMVANSTIRAPFPVSKDSTTPLSQHAHGDQDIGPMSSLTSHSSMSSLGSRSRAYSPSNEGVNAGGPSSAHSLASSGFLPNLDLQQQQNVHVQLQSKRMGPLETYESSIPLSSSSSASADSRSNSSSDEELVRGVGSVNISSSFGTVSPQLPSPNSGSGSSTGTRSVNTSDHNPPINTLYVGNLPNALAPGVSTNVLEENLRSLFSRCAGFRKLCFRQKSNGLMCFVEFDDVPYATRAMQDLSGHQVNGLVKGGIRLSYSKNQLGVRTPPTALGSSSQHQSRQNTMQAFGSSSSYSSIQEAFNSRQSMPGVLQVDTRGTRREHDVISPSYGYTTSPPPRFFSPDAGYGFPSSSGSIHGGSLSRSTSQSFHSFSPFESSTPPSGTPHLEAPDPMSLKNILSSSPSLDI